MLAYTGHLSASEYVRRKQQEWEAVRKTKAQHRCLKRWERIAKDLDKVEQQIRDQHRICKRYDEPKRSSMHLLKRRNKLVKMLEEADRSL